MDDIGQNEDHNGPLIDLTINRNENTEKLFNNTKGYVKKYFKFLDLPMKLLISYLRIMILKHWLVHSVPLDSETIKITKLNGIMPSLSAVYNLIIRTFPHVEAALEKPYIDLRHEVGRMFIHKFFNGWTPLVDHSDLRTGMRTSVDRNDRCKKISYLRISLQIDVVHLL